MRTFLFSLIVLAVAAASVSAQSLSRIRREAPAVGVEVSSVQFKNSASSTMTSSGFLLSGWLRPGGSTIVTVELPYISSSWEVHYNDPYFSFQATTSKASIGNLAIGVLTGAPDAGTTGEFQVVFPTMSKDDGIAGIGGIFGDALHAERYVPETYTLNAGVRYRSIGESGFMPSVHGGVSTWINSANNSGEDVELLLDYGVGVGYNGPFIGFFAGLDGRTIVTEEEYLAPGKRSIYMITFEADALFSNIRPSVFIRIPIDKALSDAINNTLGAGVSVIL